MIVALVTLGLIALAVSIAFAVTAVRWTLRQVNADDFPLDWEDCL